MFAVIKANGFQYVVSKGEVITIPADLGELNTDVRFDQVLMIKDNGNTIVGKPYIKDAAVTGVIKKSGKLPKVIVYKFKRRLKYRRKRGHRQDFCAVQITDIIKP